MPPRPEDSLDDPHGPLPLDYLLRLAELHAALRPRTYLEIGVFSGRSLRLAGPETRAVGVDPLPELDEPLGPQAQLFVETSDAFFAGRDVAALFGGAPLDLAFIDGMHLFEFALRDLVNAARYAAKGAVFAVHDTLPSDRRMALRRRETKAWAGDVWKLVPALRRFCPEVAIATVDVAPTGFTLLGNPAAAVALAARLDEVVAAFLPLGFDWFEAYGRAAAGIVADGPGAVASAIAAISSSIARAS